MAKKTKPKKRPAKAKAEAVPKKPNTRTIRNVRGALPIKGVPDPIKMGQLQDLVREPKVKLGGRDSSTFSSVLESKTPQQAALEKCGQWYKRLAADSPRVLTAVASMMAIRRTYAVAYRELNDAIAEAQAGLDEKKMGEEIPTEFSDFAVQYAMWMASKPFNEHELMTGIVDTMLPWLADVVDKHTEADSVAALEERVKLNEERKATPLPVGFKHTPTQEEPVLGRDKAVVLVGWKNAVQWLIDQACESVLADDHQFQIVRMLTKAPKPEDQHARVVRLAPSAWGGCANTDRDIDKMVALFIDPSVGGPVDLVVFDNLSLAFTGGFIGRNEFAQAGDAHRRLRKWVDKMGAGLVAAVPVDTWELPDFTGSEFEQLKTFAYLRPVFVQDGADDEKGDHYKVTVGTDASVFYVPKTTLDAYGTSNLIVPGGVQ